MIDGVHLLLKVTNGILASIFGMLACGTAQRYHHSTETCQKMHKHSHHWHEEWQCYLLHTQKLLYCNWEASSTKQKFMNPSPGISLKNWM